MQEAQGTNIYGVLGPLCLGFKCQILFVLCSCSQTREAGEKDHELGFSLLGTKKKNQYFCRFIDDILASRNLGFVVGADGTEFLSGTTLLQENQAVEHLGHFLWSPVFKIWYKFLCCVLPRDP